MVVPGFADGGFVDVTASQFVTGPAAKAAKSSTSAQKTAAAQLSAQGAIQFRVDNSDLPHFLDSIRGTAAQINTAMTKLISDVHAAALKGLGSDSIIPLLRRESGQLEALAVQRINLTNKIKQADTDLAAARQKVTDEATTVRGAIVGTFSVTGAGHDVNGNVTATSILDDLKKRTASAQTFAKELGALSRHGLNKTLIQQLAEAGPDQSGATVDALSKAGGGQISSINNYFAKLNKVGDLAGHSVGQVMYGAGVSHAQGIVAGLQSQERAVLKQMTSLAGKMTAQLQKDLQLDPAFVRAVAAAVGVKSTGTI
jgi:hypothetical protein